MRPSTIALALQSVSFPIAVLASYTTPHVPKEYKIIDCVYKTFDASTLANQISIINYYGGVSRLPTVHIGSLGALYTGRWGNAKAMYYDDGSSGTHYLYEMQSNRDNINKYMYTLVVDNESRACAVLEKIVPLNSDTPDYGEDSGNPLSGSSLCSIR